MATMDQAFFVSSPINDESLHKLPIESDLSKSSTRVLYLIKDVKNNRDLFDKSINIIDIGNDTLSEIQQIIDKSSNPSEFKKKIEVSSAFQTYNNCLSKFENFNQLDSTDEEVRQEIARLNNELETSTDELRELSNKLNSENTKWNGKVKKKIRAFSKMINIKKGISASEKEIKTCEIESDFVYSLGSPIIGSKSHITKGIYATKHVVIKEVGNFEKDNPKLLELKREVDFMKKFRDCDHIIDLYGFIRRGMHCSVISRWYNYNLHDYLSNNLNLELTKKLTIAYGIANALNFIHEKDILHYDIRSENVFLDDSLQAKLYNFRIVKDSPITLTSANEPTDPRWTSPEIFQGKKYTKASEIYSLSLVLWEIINHQTPYHDESVDDIKNKVLDGKHPQPEATIGTPEDYQNIMEKGWNLLPENRPTTKEMRDILNKVDFEARHQPNRMSRISKNEDVNNNFLSPNSALKGDDASSIKSDFSVDMSDYISPEGLTATTYVEKSKGLDKLNPFKKQLDFEEAVRLHNEKQYHQAWKIFKETEKRTQTPDSKFWVGFYYLKGHYNGSGKPNAKASEYLYEAAKNDHTDAQCWYAIAILNFGMIPEKYSGEEHVKLANEYLHRAAKQNHPYALKTLGSIIKKGQYGNTADVSAGRDMIERARGLISRNEDYQRPRSSIDIRDTRPTGQLTRLTVY